MTAPDAPRQRHAKAQARTHIRDQRKAIPAAQRDSDAVAMAMTLAQADLPIASTTVAAFMSLPSEPQTHPLIELCQSRRCQILIPAVRGKHLDWMVLPPDGAQFKTGVLGISEVLGASVGQDAEPLQNCSLVFVPCLAVNGAGRRLGQGGGYYDRILAALAPAAQGGPLLVGVCFAHECGIEIPVEPHDAALDGCLTGAGLHWFERT